MTTDYSNYTHEFRVNDRVRFASENPDTEPVGTIVETGYCSVKIAWDDGHDYSLVSNRSLSDLEKV